MNLNYFKEEEKIGGNNNIKEFIIVAKKNELLVKYATGGLSKKICFKISTLFT
jgi:hypothetical protein